MADMVQANLVRWLVRRLDDRSGWVPVPAQQQASLLPLTVCSMLTARSVSAWAEGEARRRMEERGDLPKYIPTEYETRPYKD